MDRHAEIGRVSETLSEKPSESLAKNALPDRITTLLKAKRDALRMRYEAFVQLRERGILTFSESNSLRSAHADWIDAELEITTIPADRIKLLRENVDGAAQFERDVVQFNELGGNGGGTLTVTAVRAARFDAELRLARELVAQQAKPLK